MKQKHQRPTLGSQERIHLDAYLDEVQDECPSLRGLEAREALKGVYLDVNRTVRILMAQQLFENLRTRLIADLDLLHEGTVLPDEIIEIFRRSPASAMRGFLNSTYAAILNHVAEIGGLIVVGEDGEPVAPLVAASSIEVTDSLSPEDELFISISKEVGKA